MTRRLCMAAALAFGLCLLAIIPDSGLRAAGLPAQLTDQELTNSAKKDAAKKREKRTLEEQERDLLATAGGQEEAKAHQQKAEELYRRALDLDNPTPVAHRGLGMLYEKQGRKDEALSEYQKYLDLAAGAADRERIQKRIENLRRPAA